MVRSLGSLIRSGVILVFAAHLGLMSGCAVLQIDGDQKQLAEAVERDKLKAELYKKAEDAYQKREIGEAQKLFESLVAEFPDVAVAHYRLGNIAFMHKNLKAAGDYFEKAVSLKPRDSKAHYNLAMVRLLQAERHLKFYTATVDPEVDISAIATFLGAIDRFSNELNTKRTDEDSLDSIVGVIDKRQ